MSQRGSQENRSSQSDNQSSRNSTNSSDGDRFSQYSEEIENPVLNFEEQLRKLNLPGSHNRKSRATELRAFDSVLDSFMIQTQVPEEYVQGIDDFFEVPDERTLVKIPDMEFTEGFPSIPKGKTPPLDELKAAYYHALIISFDRKDNDEQMIDDDELNNDDSGDDSTSDDDELSPGISEPEDSKFKRSHY